MRSVRAWTTAALALASALAAALLLAPILAEWMWIARLALRETSLSISAAAALAAWLARGVEGSRLRRVSGWMLPVAVVGLVPFAAQWVRLERVGLSFSPLEYVGAPRHAPVSVEPGLLLAEGSVPLRADVYRAPGAGPHPFVVAVHGGSWRGGARGQGAHQLRAIAAAGHTVFDVEYGLAPAHPFPAGIGDVKCAVGSVRARARELDVAPDRGVLLGRSAGGQIALLAAYSAGDLRVPPTCAVTDEPVQGVIGLYAPVDLVYGHANPMTPDVIESTRSIELYLGGSPRSRREAYRLASPRSWVDHRPPPTLLLHGETDTLVGSLHSELLAAELVAAGRPVRLVRVPFGDHAFDMRPGSVGEQLARGAILAFLAAR